MTARVSPPDMSGLTGDWQRLRDMRNASDKPSDQADESVRDATTSRDHDVTGDSRDQEQAGAGDDAPAAPEPGPKPKPRRQTAARRPAPRAADAVALTVRFEPDESDDIDDFLRDLRRAAGRRRLDKAEAVRELLRLAREHEPTRKALVRRLS